MELSTVKATLKTEILGRNLVYFKETTSTNAIAKNLASTGAPEGLVVVADVQTEGRGRGEHRWVSPPGGLWFSIVLRPAIQPSAAPLLSLVAGAAVAKALRDLHYVNAKVKWPNDVLVDGKKLCGILLEASSQGDRLDYIVVGIGIDVNNPSSELKLEDAVAEPISIREIVGKDVDIVALLAYVLLEFEKSYQHLLRSGARPVIDDWSKLSDTLGKLVKVSEGGKEVSGTARRVTPDGALVIDTGKEEIVVTGGDVRYL